jgi:prolyl-tRNA editing enzyme YbaK/EbsC (Cys-tRNA(Pro) deacylase)
MEKHMLQRLSPSAQKVQASLTAGGFACEVVELPASTHTAKEAADAIGCTLPQIVKSLVFKARQTGQAILVIASGSNRVSERKLADILGEPIEKASADFVREKTGFVIGGVPPLAHAEPMRTFLDEDLRQYPDIWAAGGSPTAVFRLAAEDLARMTGGQWIRIQ